MPLKIGGREALWPFGGLSEESNSGPSNGQRPKAGSALLPRGGRHLKLKPCGGAGGLSSQMATPPSGLSVEVQWPEMVQDPQGLHLHPHHGGRYYIPLIFEASLHLGRFPHLF